jgi:hypothetical protein
VAGGFPPGWNTARFFVLGGALAAGAASDAPTCEVALAPPGEPVTLRFEHYELLQAEDGRPIELVRCAMGITYKALDVDLHCLVALKDGRALDEIFWK